MAKHVLAAVGNALGLPAVSIVRDAPGTDRLRLKVSGRRGATREYEFTREELRLVAQAVFDALDWPGE